MEDRHQAGNHDQPRVPLRNLVDELDDVEQGKGGHGPRGQQKHGPPSPLEPDNGRQGRRCQYRGHKQRCGLGVDPEHRFAATGRLTGNPGLRRPGSLLVNGRRVAPWGGLLKGRADSEGDSRE